MVKWSPETSPNKKQASPVTTLLPYFFSSSYKSYPTMAETTPKIPIFLQLQWATASSHQSQTLMSIFSISASSPVSPKLFPSSPLFSAKTHRNTTKIVPLSPSQLDLTHNQTHTPLCFLIISTATLARSSKLWWTRPLPLFPLSIFCLFCRLLVWFTPVNKTPSPFHTFSSEQLYNKLQ